MQDNPDWQAANEHYLATALAWLRLRLLAQSQAEDVPATNVAEAAAAVAEAERTEPPPLMLLLADRLGLSRFERTVLLLCAALELDPGIAALCAQAHGDASRPYPTFALALTLFDDAAWDVISPERPLRFWRLIEIDQSDPQPLMTSAIRADERVVLFLKGLHHLDDRLAPFLTYAGPFKNQLALPNLQRALVESVGRRLDRAAQHDVLPIIQLLGSKSAGKLPVAQAIAAGLGFNLYRLPAHLLPGPLADFDTFVRLWQRECLLMPLSLYIDASDLERSASNTVLETLLRFLAQCRGIIFLDTYERLSDLNRDVVMMDLAGPTRQEQHQAWIAALGPGLAEDANHLASQFNLELSSIREVARTVLDDEPRNDREPSNGTIANRLWDACLSNALPRLESLAESIDTRATWDDIVLPAAELELLKRIAGQVRHRATVYETWGFRHKMNRGLGISALFVGESGTGKTMAAEVIANELRLSLIRIDLSTVVSKYIGETEKNLRRLFDAAEDGGSILFFDEADALFGKRSEIKDSHDRYANIEINYLLQRLESFRGLAILASNMKNALDPAFLRRLRFVVQFPFPGPAERRAIWQRAFPPEMPQDGLDLDQLATFNLTGGSIHNIALNAAFQAAQVGTAVTLAIVFDTIRVELRKLERPIHEADFRLQAPIRLI